MMPLLLADVDKEYTIQKVGGSAEVKKHLENLGFCAGGKITVVNTINGNMIVKVKDLLPYAFGPEDLNVEEEQ